MYSPSTNLLIFHSYNRWLSELLSVAARRLLSITGTHQAHVVASEARGGQRVKHDEPARERAASRPVKLRLL